MEVQAFRPVTIIVETYTMFSEWAAQLILRDIIPKQVQVGVRIVTHTEI